MSGHPPGFTAAFRLYAVEQLYTVYIERMVLQEQPDKNTRHKLLGIVEQTQLLFDFLRQIFNAFAFAVFGSVHGFTSREKCSILYFMKKARICLTFPTECY